MIKVPTIETVSSWPLLLPPPLIILTLPPGTSSSALVPHGVSLLNPNDSTPHPIPDKESEDKEVKG